MNHPLVAQVEKDFKKKNIPDPRPGDVIRVHQVIKEGAKERVQIFEGVVIKRQHGNEMGATYTVRKIAVGGVGVERTFLLHSPIILKIERVKTTQARRAKLFYLRDTKSSKIKLKGEKADKTVWEEPEAEKVLEEIKLEQAEEAELKAEEEAKEEEEMEEKFEQAQSKHETSDNTDGQSGGESGGDLPPAKKVPDSKN